MWQRMGVTGNGEFPVFPKRHDVLLIMGSGRGIWEDMSAAYSKEVPFDTMAINDMIMHCYRPSGWMKVRLDHAVCFDKDQVHHYRELAVKSGARAHPITSHSNSGEADCVWGLDNRYGICFSGCFAPFIAILMGYRKIMLAGIPNDGSGHYWAPCGEHGYHGHEEYFNQWKRHEQFWGDKVRSFSGWTMQYFGKPTFEWLEAEDEKTVDHSNDHCKHKLPCLGAD